jgi:hypothetical protein
LDENGFLYRGAIWRSFTANNYILWPFGIVCGHLVYFSRFGMLYQQKSGSPGVSAQSL